MVQENTWGTTQSKPRMAGKRIERQNGTKMTIFTRLKQTFQKIEQDTTFCRSPFLELQEIVVSAAFFLH
jgi:hypothetical protein